LSDLVFIVGLISSVALTIILFIKKAHLWLILYGILRLCGRIPVNNIAGEL